MNNREKVELHTAYAWTCPDCGIDHFERALDCKVAPEDEAEIKEQLGVEPWEDGELVVMPIVVVCPKCAREFEVFGHSQDDSQDYEGEDYA